MANHEGGVHFRTVLLTNQLNYLTVKRLFAVSIVFSRSLKKNATLFKFNAVVKGLAIMTALPAYPVSKVGRSSLQVLLILLAVTIIQY